jgi:AcrR family transcriptional regulator
MRSGGDKAATFIQSARRAQIVACAIEVIAEIGWARSAVLYHFGNKDNLVDAIIGEMYRTALAVVVPAVNAESTASGRLTAYIRANVAYFDTYRVHLTALTQISASYKPSDGRAFEELGLSPELSEQLAALDPAAILTAGQHDREFGDFPVTSMSIALRGAVNAVVEKILRDPDFDAPAYGEDLVAIFGRAIGVRR